MIGLDDMLNVFPIGAEVRIWAADGAAVSGKVLSVSIRSKVDIYYEVGYWSGDTFSISWFPADMLTLQTGMSEERIGFKT